MGVEGLSPRGRGNREPIRKRRAAVYPRVGGGTNDVAVMPLLGPGLSPFVGGLRFETGFREPE